MFLFRWNSITTPFICNTHILDSIYFHNICRHSIKFLEGDICPSSPDYSLFAKDGIHSLLAVPLWGENQVEGVVGVDNPTENIDDMTLLQSS